MRLSDWVEALGQIKELHFELPDGSMLPAHFHITELGLMTKHFVDCGNTVRKEHRASFQVWVAGDTDHRLTPQKTMRIIEASKPLMEGMDPELQVEYQGTDTIGVYNLAFNKGVFTLEPTYTTCLASDACGIPASQMAYTLVADSAAGVCTPGGGCC
jgi:hypothetical protein